MGSLVRPSRWAAPVGGAPNDHGAPSATGQHPHDPKTTPDQRFPRSRDASSAGRRSVIVFGWAPPAPVERRFRTVGAEKSDRSRAGRTPSWGHLRTDGSELIPRTLPSSKAASSGAMAVRRCRTPWAHWTTGSDREGDRAMLKRRRAFLPFRRDAGTLAQWHAVPRGGTIGVKVVSHQSARGCLALRGTARDTRPSA
jgi:hypothetical protein